MTLPSTAAWISAWRASAAYSHNICSDPEHKASQDVEAGADVPRRRIGCGVLRNTDLCQLPCLSLSISISGSGGGGSLLCCLWSGLFSGFEYKTRMYNVCMDLWVDCWNVPILVYMCSFWRLLKGVAVVQECCGIHAGPTLYNKSIQYDNLVQNSCCVRGILHSVFTTPTAHHPASTADHQKNTFDPPTLHIMAALGKRKLIAILLLIYHSKLRHH